MIEMPGENCCFNGCGINRRNKGFSLFKLPSEKLYPEYRAKWIAVIKKYRVMDSNLKQQIEKDRVHVCERHFKAEELELCKFFLLSNFNFYTFFTRSRYKKCTGFQMMVYN